MARRHINNRNLPVWRLTDTKEVSGTSLVGTRHRNFFSVFIFFCHQKQIVSLKTLFSSLYCNWYIASQVNGKSGWPGWKTGNMKTTGAHCLNFSCVWLNSIIDYFLPGCIGEVFLEIRKGILIHCRIFNGCISKNKCLRIFGWCVLTFYKYVKISNKNIRKMVLL